jgi:2-succinyl-5-enolpyruvyl-6-hydroxy-3-cyclohexene-1-carboxylate synthase
VITDAANANQLISELLVEELVRLGVTMFFLSPGSRSAPLAVAAVRHPKTSCIVHFDERGTAFAALGFGRARLSPAVWITTSGTAVANGLPAIVEASQDGIPLVALTADRPPELRKTGSNQTIDQPAIFGDYVRWRFDLPPADRTAGPEFVLTAVDQAVHRAISDPGPIHLNCMFREPLAPVPDTAFQFSPGQSLARWLETGGPFTRYDSAPPGVTAEYVEMVADLLSRSQSGLVVAGRLRSEAEGAAAAAVAKRLGWPLVPDVLSFCRHLGGGDALAYIDLLLGREDVRSGLRPQTVLHFGGRSTSKRLYEQFDRHPPEHFILVSPLRERIDPVHNVTHRIEADVGALCHQLLDVIPGAPTNGDGAGSVGRLGSLQHALDRLLDERLDGRWAASEPFTAREIARRMPSDHELFVGSSMPIRDIDSFASPCQRLPTWGNRGASGIDGTVASAVGLAAGRRRPVTLLLGDLALLHDLNSLGLVKSSRYPVVIVVVNNNGGGIFSFLPIARYREVFEPCFGTPHGLRFEEAASMFGLPYYRVGASLSISEAYRIACDAGASSLIEVSTDRSENQALHEDLVDAVRDIVVQSATDQPSLSDRV